ncbi:putative manganese catalase [Nocardia cerradoensis]|uniref:Putative manganese catalase n=1 Tax=Nocardia cerradoensis TaxID=85688 RepID=A0A231H3I0_9NOCA|nr:putative manganese catalase [Nocardia cerradoensis]
MDIATEEFSHLEIVGSMITMLLDGLNDDVKQANERCDWMPVVSRSDGREAAIHQVAADPLFFALRGGGPDVGNSAGVPWAGAYVNSNGEPSVDLRSNLAAETRAKIVYSNWRISVPAAANSRRRWTGSFPPPGPLSNSSSRRCGRG